jgi:hypothetical protein
MVSPIFRTLAGTTPGTEVGSELQNWDPGTESATVGNYLSQRRLERAVLFGSRARGGFKPDSDHDVAVFLYGYRDLWTELKPLGVITTDILMDTGGMISAKPFPARSYRERRAFMG